jgi:hypothetical protein
LCHFLYLFLLLLSLSLSLLFLSFLSLLSQPLWNSPTLQLSPSFFVELVVLISLYRSHMLTHTHTHTRVFIPSRAYTHTHILSTTSTHSHSSIYTRSLSLSLPPQAAQEKVAETTEQLVRAQQEAMYASTSTLEKYNFYSLEQMCAYLQAHYEFFLQGYAFLDTLLPELDSYRAEIRERKDAFREVFGVDCLSTLPKPTGEPGPRPPTVISTAPTIIANAASSFPAVDSHPPHTASATSAAAVAAAASSSSSTFSAGTPTAAALSVSASSAASPYASSPAPLSSSSSFSSSSALSADHPSSGDELSGVASSCSSVSPLSESTGQPTRSGSVSRVNQLNQFIAQLDSSDTGVADQLRSPKLRKHRLTHGSESTLDRAKQQLESDREDTKDGKSSWIKFKKKTNKPNEKLASLVRV